MRDEEWGVSESKHRLKACRSSASITDRQKKPRLKAPAAPGWGKQKKNTERKVLKEGHKSSAGKSRRMDWQEKPVA